MKETFEKKTFYKINYKSYENSEPMTIWRLIKMHTWSDGRRELCWVNPNGGLMPNHSSVKVLETVEARCFEDLDWNGTYMTEDTKYDSGWLSREGKWYGCASQDHDAIAYYLLKNDIDVLETTGWARVHSKELWFCKIKLSVEQRNWFAKYGYKLEEYD